VSLPSRPVNPYSHAPPNQKDLGIIFPDGRKALV
jgi:hypothetical protein